MGPTRKKWVPLFVWEESGKMINPAERENEGGSPVEGERSLAGFHRGFSQKLHGQSRKASRFKCHFLTTPR